MRWHKLNAQREMAKATVRTKQHHAGKGKVATGGRTGDPHQPRQTSNGAQENPARGSKTRAQTTKPPGTPDQGVPSSEILSVPGAHRQIYLRR